MRSRSEEGRRGGEEGKEGGMNWVDGNYGRANGQMNAEWLGGGARPSWV